MRLVNDGAGRRRPAPPSSMKPDTPSRPARGDLAGKVPAAAVRGASGMLSTAAACARLSKSLNDGDPAR